MKSFSIYAGIAALAVTSAAVLYAAPGDMQGRDPQRAVTKAEAMKLGDARFAKMDANGDGMLNAADRTAMLSKRFAAIDTDKNGAISEAEFMAMHEARADRRSERRAKAMERGMMGEPGMRGEPGMMRAHGGPRGGRGAMAMMKRADTNGDQAVSQAEFRAAVEERFAKADTNNDGTISAEERQANRKGKWRDRMAPAQPDAG